jgi:PST family polysaccharide transporter
MGLRNQALKGGFIMVIRQGLGLLLSLIGVVFVTKIIGPSQYGLYGASYGIIFFLGSLGSWGLDVYLLRKSTNPEKHEYDQVFTLLLCISLIITTGILVGQQAIGQMLKIPQVAPIVAILAFTIPLSLLNLPATVKLDRDLNFQRVALIELVSQISYYLIAVPLALQGAGAWSPVSGLLTQQIIQITLFYWSSKFLPRLCWDTTLIRQMLSYGFSYSSSGWVWQLRTLVNPIIVGRFAGPEAVGFVALATRFVEMLSFAKMVTWRIAMAALAKLKDDKIRLRKSIEEAMRLQTIAVGLPMASFAIVGPVLLLLIFGKDWTSALQVFPFIAIGYLSNSIFSLHSSVLYLLGKNLEVTWFHVTYVLILGVSAFLLVPSLGIVGYGWAEICALASYIVIHYYTVKQIDSIDYKEAFIWYVVCAAAIVMSTINPVLRYVCSCLLLLPLISTEQRKSLIHYVQILRS